MKNITLSADDHLIELARQTAKAQHKTLNQAFREWLSDYTSRQSDAEAIATLYKELSHVNLGGRRFTREERNER